ncbi:MAG: hypothetical protein AAGD25_06790 [Cyanobacteria bacterium P01_F01_bin.150]
MPHLKLNLFHLQYNGPIEYGTPLHFSGTWEELQCLDVLPGYETEKRLLIDGSSDRAFWCNTPHDDVEFRYEDMIARARYVRKCVPQPHPVVMILPDVFRSI